MMMIPIDDTVEDRQPRAARKLLEALKREGRILLHVSVDLTYSFSIQKHETINFWCSNWLNGYFVTEIVQY